MLLLHGLHACPVSHRQLRSLNRVVLPCAGKNFNVNTVEIAAECRPIKMFGISEIAEALATRKDRFIKRYESISNVVCEMCTIYIVYTGS